MSKVKIQGHASGTGVLTVTAPNTSTDRTITLPDGTGTLLTTDGDGSSLTGIQSPLVEGTDYLAPDGDGSSLTGVGVDGISSSADATAITINSSEDVGIGVTPETWETGWTGLQVGGIGAVYASTTPAAGSECTISLNTYINSSGQKSYILTDEASRYRQDSGIHYFDVASSGTADAAISFTTALEITNDGRGLSQFTAKAWVNFNGSGTLAIRDSHNVSSVTDDDTGKYTVNFSNNLANANFSSTITASNWEVDANIDSYMVASLRENSSQAVGYQKFVTTRLNGGYGNFKDPKTVCCLFFGD
jgi:hypothetical protein